MKLKTLIMVGAAALFSATAVKAEHVSNWSVQDRFAYAHEGELFLPNEFSLDAFGSYTTTGRRNFGELFTHNLRHGAFGGGLGLNYFFTKYVGIGGDVQMGDTGNRLVDSTSANLILRLPLDAAHLAPYVFAGGGLQIDPRSQLLGDVGAGVDFRLNHWTGIFVDGRFIWTAKSGDYGLLRAGMRFAF